jgi:hypothetical protein
MVWQERREYMVELMQEYFHIPRVVFRKIEIMWIEIRPKYVVLISLG